MWNLNMKYGTIWSVKSRNQYENLNYDGMINGSGYVLILSVFTNEYNEEKFTYLRSYNTGKHISSKYIINTSKYNWDIDLTNIYTGDQLALETYQETISLDDFNNVTKLLRDYYNLNKIKEVKSKKQNKEKTEIYQQRIHKFGIDIFVVENEDVKINPKNKKLLLSNKAKEDIIYNSKTEEDIRILCDKYQIYPIKAIKEIRNRLVYQHKQKEG